ncbi:MAG TPA: hypothetical protein VKE98_08240 [Gemmataceae bacterium]|nr:hypothetical protein [Gemmataceae bacterium]
MEVHYPTIDEPATPEYVLAVLRDMHRQQCQFDPEADSSAVLSMDTTVEEWRDACGLVRWRQLAHAYNEMWQLNCSDAEWRQVLEPAHRKRLAGVCALIAGRAIRRVIRPSQLLGNSCLSAGAFLTIRSILNDAGAPANEIAPSTPLAPYTRSYVEAFLGPISRLAPGALPLVRIRAPVYDTAMLGAGLALICSMVGAIIGSPVLAIFGVVLFAFCYGLTWFAARSLRPASVEFGELRTFRDLAIVIVDGKST